MTGCCNNEPTATPDAPADHADLADLAKAFAELTALKTKILELTKRAAKLPVQDYTFKRNPDGNIHPHVTLRTERQLLPRLAPLRPPRGRPQQLATQVQILTNTRTK